MPLNSTLDQTVTMAPRSLGNFVFERDSLDFVNGLIWVYQPDTVSGKMTFSRRIPKPDYSHRCFALARVVRQFFYHARFAGDEPVTTAEVYRQRVRAVLGFPPRLATSSAPRITIPGFAGLREFSQIHEVLLKDEAGAKWRSYFLRSHWRMILPFSRAHQSRTAKALAAALRQNYLPIIHQVKFPALTINHGMLLFGMMEIDGGLEFQCCDPNNSKNPERLIFDWKAQTFTMPPNDYWAGGPLDISHIYRSWIF